MCHSGHPTIGPALSVFETRPKSCDGFVFGFLPVKLACPVFVTRPQTYRVFDVLTPSVQLTLFRSPQNCWQYVCLGLSSAFGTTTLRASLGVYLSCFRGREREEKKTATPPGMAFYGAFAPRINEAGTSMGLGLPALPGETTVPPRCCKRATTPEIVARCQSARYTEEGREGGRF